MPHLSDTLGSSHFPSLPVPHCYSSLVIHLLTTVTRSLTRCLKPCRPLPAFVTRAVTHTQSLPLRTVGFKYLAQVHGQSSATVAHCHPLILIVTHCHSQLLSLTHFTFRQFVADIFRVLVSVASMGHIGRGHRSAYCDGDASAISVRLENRARIV